MQTTIRREIRNQQFFLRLNNYRKMQSPHQRTLFQLANIFYDSNHEFNRDAVFIINEEIKNSQKTKQEKRILLMKRKNFWINKLRTMTPNGLNRDLNNV